MSALASDESVQDAYYVLVANVDELDQVLNSQEGFGELCCESCSTSIVLPENAVLHPHQNEIQSVRPIQSRLIESKGFYKVVFINCASQVLSLTGQVAAHNPYGYIPGGQSGFLLLYPVLSVLHLVLLILWTASLWWYRYSTVYIQKYCLSGILVICLLDDAFEAIDWSHYNANGVRSPMLLTSGLLFGAWQNTAARLLLLVVCMGWGVIRESLESSTKVLGLGMLYFFNHFSSSLVLQISKQRAVSLTVKLLTVLPVVILNIMIFAWVWYSLKKIQAQLLKARQSIKLKLFDTLRVIVGGAAILASLCVVVEG